jgi:hypothetical protein
MEHRPRSAVQVNHDSRIQAAFERLLADIDACGWWNDDFNRCEP